MDFEFFKIRVCGNDLILVSFLLADTPETALLPALSKRLCDRVRGVGGSSVVYITERSGDRFHIRHYLSGGKESAVYPDALVCACQYLFDSGNAGPAVIRLLESGVERDVKVVDSNHFTVRLGEPHRLDGSIIREEGGIEYTNTVTIEGKTAVISPLVLVQPLSVVFIDDEVMGVWRGLSRNLSTCDDIPVQPVCTRVYTPENLRIRVAFNRRGKDFISCAGGATVASVLNGFCERQVLVRTGRSDLHVHWNEEINEVFVTASAAYSFSGFFYYEPSASGR